MQLLRKMLKMGGIIVLIILLVLFIVRIQAPEVRLSKSIPEIDRMREARAISSFFGLDNTTPWIGVLISWKVPGKDGMPVVFSHEIDPETLDESDFEITTKNGHTHQPDVVTLLPANEEFELRTVLMIGQFGEHPDDPPMTTEIVGDLLSRTGQNFKGQVVAVTPLPEGPFLSYSEYFELDDAYPYVEKGRGCDCPREGTEQVVRLIWSGGVRALNGEELGQAEIDNFRVTMVQGSDTLVVKPYKLADLADNDNNTDLCLKEAGIPIRVQVDANTAIDPRGDANPQTEIEVRSRW